MSPAKQRVGVINRTCRGATLQSTALAPWTSAFANTRISIMNWRVRIVSNDLSIYRWRHYPRPSLRGCRLPYPFHSKSAFFHRCSSQWTSKRRVFPIFDLGLLDSSLIEEELSTRHEPKELHTYPVGDEHVLNNRYQVLHKIGYGPTATLWQAIDLM